jgi:hypothetical protein
LIAIGIAELWLSFAAAAWWYRGGASAAAVVGALVMWRAAAPLATPLRARLAWFVPQWRPTPRNAAARRVVLVD